MNDLGPLGSAAHRELAPTQVGLLGTAADAAASRWQKERPKERQNRAFRGGGMPRILQSSFTAC